MKASLQSAVVILAVCGYLGWEKRVALATAREEHDRVLAEAAALGIDPSAPAADDLKHFAAKLQRRESSAREAQAISYASKLVAFVKKMKEMEHSGNEPNEAQQQEILSMLAEMIALDAAQLKVLIAELRRSPDLDDSSRREVLNLSMMMLASEHPEAALNLVAESSDLLEPQHRDQAITAAIGKLAKDNPLAAVDWIRRHLKEHPELASNNARKSAVEGISAQDPKLAFSLLREWTMTADFNLVGGIVREAAKDPAARATMLESLRDYLKEVPEDMRRSVSDTAMSALANRATVDGFEKSSAWLSTTNLSPEEILRFTTSLTYSRTEADTGKWISWMQERLPAEAAGRKSENLLREWATKDYQAAAHWINESPGGPARDRAIRTYAETVAPYERLPLRSGRKRFPIPLNAKGCWTSFIPVGKRKTKPPRHGSQSRMESPNRR